MGKYDAHININILELGNAVSICKKISAFSYRAEEYPHDQ